MQNDTNENINAVMNTDKYLDCKELKCPMPIVRLSKEMKQMTAGQTITVEASDPAFKSDIRAWIKTMDYELIEFKDDCIQTAVVRKT